MARLPAPLDPNDYPDERALLPDGEYLVSVDDTELVEMSGGRLSVKVTHTVLGPCYAGVKLFNRCWYIHPNETAQRIGRAQLARMGEARGIDGPVENTTQLHGAQLFARVKTCHDEGYDPSNEVTSYKVPQRGEQPKGPRDGGSSGSGRGLPGPGSSAGHSPTTAQGYTDWSAGRATPPPSDEDYPF